MAYNYLSFGLQTSDVIGITAEQRTAVEFQMTFSVVDEASWLYKNFKLPRYRNSYGFAQIMSGAYVVEVVPLQFLNQEVLAFEYDTFDINDNIGCAVKAIVAAMTPPGSATINVSKHRTRLTGVRFRLYAGIQANVGIRWVTAESNCNNTISEPDPKQGQPIAPNNSSSNPGSRPGSQGGDETDKSANDGNYDPDGGLPPPPAPGGGTNFPCWVAYYTGTKDPPTCTEYAGRTRLVDATDPTIRPVYQVTAPNVFCQSTNGIITYNGATISNPEGIVAIDFYYG